MMNIFSLELAIYFILPPLVIFAAAYITAGIFMLVAQPMIGRYLLHDKAVTSMAILITLTTGIAFFVHWTTQNRSYTITAATVSLFLIGAITYARLIEDYSPCNIKRRVGPIGLAKGIRISAVFTLLTLVIGSLIAVISLSLR